MFSSPQKNNNSRKRNKNRRRRNRRLHVATTEEARIEHHNEMKEDEIAFTAVEEETGRRLNMIREELDKETEAFLSNIPFTVVAKDLVTFIESRLHGGINVTSRVVRCQMLLKDGRRSGCALVVFKTKELFNQFKDMQNTLSLQGRILKVKEGNGNSLRKSKLDRAASTSFIADQIQIGYPILDDDKTNKSFVMSWNHQQQKDGSTTFAIHGRERAIILSFSLNSILYRAQIPFTCIRNLQLEKDEETNMLVVRFRVIESPKLFAEEKSLATQPHPINIFGITLDLALLNGLTSDVLLWELSSSSDDSAEKWIRVVDPTPANSLGRFLKDFRLLRNKATSHVFEINLKPCAAPAKQSTETNLIPLDITEFFNYPFISSLSFQVLYWFHCLIGANKLNLENIVENMCDFTQSIDNLASEDTVVSILWDLYKNNSSKCYFIPYLHKHFEKVLEDIVADNTEFDDDDDGEVEVGNKGEIGVLLGNDNNKDEDDSLGAPIMIPRVLVTPTRICPQPPEPEPSNRVLREFIQYRDRFIRVIFVDENFGSFYQVSGSENIIEKRLRVIIQKGVYIAGQHYSLLAFSNSQIREQSCWFYDESPRRNDTSTPPTAQYIRNWVGDLRAIRVVGKHAARLGQGFSSTVPAFTVPKSEYFLSPDVERNGFCFSDGVGMISESYANRIAKNRNLIRTPSAFQIRYMGAKGMLTVMPDICLPRGSEIMFRKSMMKFESNHYELEINSYSRLMPFYLNRQLIAVLSARGIQDGYFMQLLKQMTRELNDALFDNNAASILLYRYGNVGYTHADVNAPLEAAYCMLEAGMQVRFDPYIYGIIAAIRKKLIIEIQTKARILVPKGICLLGVMDETLTLKEGEVFIQLSPQRQLGDYSGEGNGIYRPMGNVRSFADRVLVGRNPSLHPGDGRVLTPRDNIPSLSHLFDVVVFPALGNRPHPNEMSGGDLDGDIYFVCWDEDLIPKADFTPMDYTSSGKPPVDTSSPTGVTIEEIGDFYVNYIKNDNLGLIANAWMVWADAFSAECPQCIELAKLHSTAVDFAKTGIPAVFPTGLRAAKAPSFMENSFKEQYESDKVLGKIYRECKQLQARVALKAPKVDRRLIYPGYELYIDEAEEYLNEYNDRLWEIMSHYGVDDEMEALSGFVSAFSRKSAPKGGRGGEDVQMRLNKAIKDLRTYFHALFMDHDEADFTNTQEYKQHLFRKASAWYYCAYKQPVRYDQYGHEIVPMISFPWTICNILYELLQLPRNGGI